MALTINNLGTLSILNLLNKTAAAQEKTIQQMATGARINRGADDPAGLLALQKIQSELTAVDSGISNNQRTDAILSVADNALTEIGKQVAEIQRLASETANDAALTTEEKLANQAQIDAAIDSIDRIVSSTNFNGKKLLDGTLAINTTGGTGLSDIRVYSRKAGSTDTSLTVKHVTAAKTASGANFMTASATAALTFTVQGKLGTAVISVASNEKLSTTRDKINAALNQTGVSAYLSGGDLHLRSKDKGLAAFLRTKVVSGSGATELYDNGVDAVVTVNGQNAATDGTKVSYTGDGVSLSFELGSLSEGSSVAITVKGSGSGADSGATFQLGTGADTRATIGIAGAYTVQLGTLSSGYLKSLQSGGANSLLNNASQAAAIARAASTQIAEMQGRIGGFQKFQVRTSLNSLNDVKEGLTKVASAINDIDYAKANAELNKQNVLLQSSISLLGLANQQSSYVLALLK